MMKSIKKKHLLMASIAAAVVAIGGVTAILSSSGKKTALSYYDSFKERYYLQDVLSEGEISYSFFSSDLTVKNPEVRLAAVQTNGAEQFLQGLRGLFETAIGRSSEEGLMGWTMYQMLSTTGRNAAGVNLKADALKINHSGDSKDGEIHVQLLGMEMANPFISRRGAEVVLVSDLAADNEWAPAETASSEVKLPYSWGTNMAVRSPVTGAFIVGATGDFGTKVDLDFYIQRSDDGAGSMRFVVTHRNDGSEVGQIVREAEFASLPELDEVQTLLRNTLSSFIIGAYSSLTGQSVLLDAVSKFALQTKVEDYSVTFKGFSSIKDAFDSYQANAGKSQFDAFCQAAGLSTWQSDFGAKAREHSDSECAIARKLVEEGKFEEHYKFSEGKPLYASLFVGRSYELDAN